MSVFPPGVTIQISIVFPEGLSTRKLGDLERERLRMVVTLASVERLKKLELKKLYVFGQVNISLGVCM